MTRYAAPAASVLLGTLSLAGCFRAPDAPVQFSCDPHGASSCPSGYSCEPDGCCHREGTDFDAHAGQCRVLEDGEGSGMSSSTGATSDGATTGPISTGTTTDATDSTTDATDSTTDATDSTTDATDSTSTSGSTAGTTG